MKAIAQALGTRLKSFATTNNVQVAYENTLFTPPANAVWLEESYIPVAKKPLGMANNDSDIHTGIYQVTIKAPVNSTKFKALDMADLVVDYFRKGTLLGDVRIDKSDIGIGINKDANWYSVPVVIVWSFIKK